ncbi:MAG: hypothetical protein ABIS36_22240 [Chryseolinea sp.]
MKGKVPYGKVPQDVEHELSSVHIDKTWSLLEEKFCFNVKAWKQDYQAYCQKQGSKMSEQEAFVEFGTEFINPLLNKILVRKSYHNTWSNMLSYIVKKH